MSLSERQIETIHANTTFIEGKKYFGDFDRYVSETPTTEIFFGNSKFRVKSSNLALYMTVLLKSIS